MPLNHLEPFSHLVAPFNLWLKLTTNKSQEGDRTTRGTKSKSWDNSYCCCNMAKWDNKFHSSHLGKNSPPQRLQALMTCCHWKRLTSPSIQNLPLNCDKLTWNKDSTHGIYMCNFLLRKKTNVFSSGWICPAPINRSNGSSLCMSTVQQHPGNFLGTLVFSLGTGRFFLTNCLLGLAFCPWDSLGVCHFPLQYTPWDCMQWVILKKKHVWESSTKRDPVSKIYLVMLWSQWIQSCFIRKGCLSSSLTPWLPPILIMSYKMLWDFMAGASLS